VLLPLIVYDFLNQYKTEIMTYHDDVFLA
jgi:hypothetical protein